MTDIKREQEEIAAIKDEVRRAGVEIDDGQAEKLLRYMKAILEKNKELNLTSIKDESEFIRLHLADSAEAASVPEYGDAERIIDIGTGAGFPGVVLAVLSPEKEFVLLDSLKKRLAVIEELTAGLGIGNVTCLHMRAEEAGRDGRLRESFDMAVSRAVAELPVLLEYALPLVKVGGTVVSYKGTAAEEEVEKSSSALTILGGAVKDILHTGVKGSEHRLVVIKKQESSPQRYPRKPGKPARNPL